MSPVLENDTMARIRAQAAQRFEQLGWPTVRSEEWKYTSVAPLERAFASGEFAQRSGGEAPAQAGAMSLRGRAGAELVFVDGIFEPGLSDLSGMPGVKVTPFRDAAPAALDAHFARYADFETHAFTALNTANARDGAVVEADGAVEGFVHLLFVSRAGAQSHPRNLVIAARGAQIAVVETYAGSGRYFTNAVTEIVASDGAVVDHYRLECESADAFHVSTVQIHQERSSSVSSCSIAIGGALARSETNAALAGEGASLVLDGLFVTNGTRHVDNHIVIDHLKPHCESIELYKGVLDDSSRGIFDGKIVVHPGAQKTVARQTNKNLLLSESAVVDSKPTLEIFNDDVKCNHGSTIGQLDEEAMFYLRSRGIAEDDARTLLVSAFASEIVERMKIAPVRELIRQAIFQQMHGRLSERRAEGRG